MQSSRLVAAALGGVFAAGLLGGVQTPAKADTASTEAIVAGALAIVGVLLYDSNHRAYYERDGRAYYVTDDQARYYRDQHRNAYVPQPSQFAGRGSQYGYGDRQPVRALPGQGNHGYGGGRQNGSDQHGSRQNGGERHGDDGRR